MVVDAINYAGEEDILDIRLSVLDSYVDKFVLVEATETFSGLPKPLYYEENKERFKKWEHKIVHHVVDGYTEEEWVSAKIHPNTGGLDHWCREFVQRENIKKGLIKAGATDEDIVFFGDVDEIWDYPRMFKEEYAGFPSELVLKLKLRVYSYWLNNLSSEEFWGTVVSRYKNLKDASLNELKTTAHKGSAYNGWHFTSMGGVEALKKKIESYGHQELNTEEVKNGLEQRLSTGQDFIGRDFQYTLDTSAWPEFLRGNQDRYQHLIKQNA